MSALPIGYQLDDYTIDSVLGFGGFGITYKAVDIKDKLQTNVAIKEFFPRHFAVRCHDSVTVALHQEKECSQFKDGLQRFVTEAQTLRKFRHSSIVNVLRLFEKNATAYMVMEYAPGQTLQEWLTAHPTPTETELKTHLLPVLDGLVYVHKHSYLHRDIKPQNIYIREQGGPMLLDFGAARQAMGELTSMVTPGFAPFEQYHSLDPGPWIDVYAVGATLYYAVNRLQPPADSLIRAACVQAGKKDPMTPALVIGAARYSDNFLRSIDWMLQPKIEARPQSIDQIIAMWNDAAAAPINAGSPTLIPDAPSNNRGVTMSLPAQVARSSQTKSGATTQGTAQPARRSRPNAWIAMGLAAMSILAVAGFFLLPGLHSQPEGEKAQGRVTASLPAVSGAAAVTSPPQGVDAVPPATQPGASAFAVDISPLPEKFPDAAQSPTAGGADQNETGTATDTPLQQSPIAGNSATAPPTASVAQKAELRIHSDPPGAHVFLNNEESGETPIVFLFQPPATQRIRIMKFGYEEQLITQVLPEAKTYDVSVRLQRNTAQHSTRNAEDVVRASNAAADATESAAHGGDTLAQFRLYRMYQFGQNGKPRDPAAALQWLQRAAHSGHVAAQTEMGRRQEERQDYDGALAWYGRAADQGDSSAQNSLALMHYKGRGTRRDANEAVKWWTKAARAGHAEAQNNLGSMYQSGQVVSKNYEQAVSLYRAAADQGLAHAQYNLAQMVESGKGVPRDIGLAIRLYRQAAAQGFVLAQKRLRR